jgi:N-acetylglucosamine kinase-like BadF-type ATPase
VAASYFIGIDGGGTKTFAVISDEKGNLLASSRRESSNYLQVGIDKCRENLIGMSQELCKSQGIDLMTLDYSVIGLAGAGRQDDREIITRALIEGGLTDSQFVVTPDYTPALAGGAFGEAGVIVISGTGSVVFGIDEQGNQQRAGGWGPLMSDEGSGYDFGKQACRMIMRAFDGRGPATSMTEKVLKFLKMDVPTSLVKWSLTEGTQKNNVAALAPFVFEAAKEGDKVALSVLESEVDSIVEMVGAVAKAIKLTDKSFKIVLAGGNFGHQPEFVSMLREKVKSVAPQATADLPRFEPVLGAVILALKNQGIKITEEILDNLEASWPKMNM